ncbi:MAG: hypothetical protein IPO91_14280 [Chloroflexi bacterium]|mgnify:CR=1 FL=1|nr:hypothetical protein [Chloroflexota bacterium]
MSGFSAIIEVALTIIGCAFWILILVAVRPQWVMQKPRARLLRSIVEGGLCAFIWLLLLVVTANPITLESIEVAALCGVIWAVVATYIRGRYQLAAPEASL